MAECIATFIESRSDTLSPTDPWYQIMQHELQRWVTDPNKNISDLVLDAIEVCIFERIKNNGGVNAAQVVVTNAINDPSKVLIAVTLQYMTLYFLWQIEAANVKSITLDDISWDK